MRVKPVILAVITAVLIVLAWKVSQDKAPQTDIARGPLFPGVLERLNDVSRVEIKSAQHALTLERRGEAWVLASKDGFPATFATVKRAILQVAGLVTVEPKTDRPESYARIGVDDVEGDKAAGTLFDAYDADGKRLFGLIVGNSRGTAGDQHYVREVGEAQAWLVDGALTLEADPVQWLDAQVADIDTERVRQLSLSSPAGAPVVIRKSEPKDNFFALADVPAGFKAKSRATVSSIGALLLDLRFNDVMAATKVDGLTAVRRAEIQTFDGLVVTIEQFEVDGKPWSRFGFRYDTALATAPAAAATPPEPVESAGTSGDASAVPDTGDGDNKDDKKPAETVEQAALRLAAATANWVYVLPDYKQRMIAKRLEDLIEKPEDKAAGKPAP